MFGYSEVSWPWTAVFELSHYLARDNNKVTVVILGNIIKCVRMLNSLYIVQDKLFDVKAILLFSVNWIPN